MGGDVNHDFLFDYLSPQFSDFMQIIFLIERRVVKIELFGLMSRSIHRGTTPFSLIMQGANFQPHHHHEIAHEIAKKPRAFQDREFRRSQIHHHRGNPRSRKY